MNQYIKKTLGYLVPVFALGCFMLIIHGAYVPHKSAEIQRVVCIKFKPGVTAQDLEQHFSEFATMKNKIKDVVAYSAGKVQASEAGKSYDVVHYLTFRTVESADEYVQHASRKEFIDRNHDKWSEVLELNSNIEKK
ncbi:stress responsive alpha/beta barrel protein [Dyadobacter jejuensis]|uniref:Stress responsive alpha/beta barrel protein n=1 Tax=Dyadobacter jejuensis TaxID=1082580 RepID=A0A316AHN7_9BACT|nr:Dabb family protein [Dyadobacter jejuensis]PWJ56779.1 stress responsive alpha/beta barrel protein [Dyadobacter jejuensis]